MANGCLVISEPMYHHEPFLEGRHFISATVEEMPALINYYLTHEEERKMIARQGHDFVINKLRLDQSVGKLLAAIRQKSGP
jgi:spore maturation protein CgeB